MATLSRKTKQQLWAEHNRAVADLVGWSPGRAAQVLGMSRQGVHRAIQRGDLEATVLIDPETRQRVFMISDESLRSFAANRPKLST